jgi:septum formation protein
MRELSAEEVERYIASGLWEGKAGAYGIQDDDPFVTRIEGSLTNIVGLPMDEATALLARAGVVPDERGR